MIADPVAGGSCRFPRQARLTQTDEFSSVFGFKRALRGSLFMLHYQPRPDRLDARLGLVVGKKHLRAAVGRNLVKRLARETFRMKRSRLPPCDVIVRLSSKLQGLDRQALTGELESLLTRLQRRLAGERG